MAVDTGDDAVQSARTPLTARTRIAERVAAAVLIVTALAIAGTFAWDQRRPAAPVVAPVSAPRPGPSTIGAVDAPAAEAIVGTAVRISGWALDPEGVRGVEIRVGGRPYSAQYGIARPDVAQAKPGYPDSATAGFAFEGDFAPLAAQRHELTVVAISRSGDEKVLARKGLVPPAALEQWRPLYSQRHADQTPPFYIIPALSAIGLGGAAELDTEYTPYLSPTFRVGMRVPILYLRTTLGAARDWVFDPDWDIERRCGEKRIAEDSLNSVMNHAIEHHLPVLFTLNGGVWADAGCDVPDWDVNDHLEQDVANCQWNEKNEVMPDDYLKHLPGSTDAPELARSLTFNAYAAQNRHYKRRNLQAAARMIVSFTREHPELFIGIALDADTYLNPFFDEKQWYDYNPGTIRQFREWLSGSGPYAGKPAPGVPDLSRYRRKQPLSLADIRKLSGKQWRSWDEVDPPRTFPREGRPFWEDPWTHEWEVFRRHIVHLHYDHLSQWLVDVGVPKSRIYSSQGFIAPYPTAFPFALRIESPSKNYDTGGMSVEGAIPRNGHLGAIVYGESAVNNIRVEGDANLFATFHRMDPGWAVGEFNTADFRNAKELPTYAMGYRTLREMFNYGARFASPMAWNGSNGLNAGQPGYVSFTAWRNTPLEDALRDFAVAHAFVPLGARLWTFGSSQTADGDGWTVTGGATLVTGKGHVDVVSQDGDAVLLSPAPLAIARGETNLLVLGLDPAAVLAVKVAARTPDGAWVQLAPRRAADDLTTTTAGLSVPLAWPATLAVADQIRVSLSFRTPAASPRIRHIALWPQATTQVSR
ncbi:MAG: Ig-like domain-containing protein [Pseudomonadota bacterium]|nr:Ig-like domain-containing protein [Pseudomonadota bacterium]